MRLEFLMNALRLSDGFEKDLFRHRTGLELSALEPQLTQCIEESLVEQDVSHIRCTNRGQAFLDEILHRFVPE
jgi:oxygen-independent coproporphyrinogen-3 oxidase